MRRTTLPGVAVVVMIGLTACRNDAPSAVAGVGRDVDPRAAQTAYIVVLHRDVQDHRALAATLVASRGGRLGRVYTLAFKGFWAGLDSTAVAAIRRDPNVVSVNEVRTVSIDTIQQWIISGGNFDDRWGLERVDQRGRAGLLGGAYSWFHNGAGVYAYIFDTGLDSAHADYTGRAKNVYDAFGGSGQDGHGHGTHVAGIIGSRTYGVAKGVLLRGLRVLDNTGNGTDTTVINGIEWLLANKIKPAVVNMSLGGGFSESINLAVQSLVDSGLFVAVSAGNDDLNACAFSPASAPNAFTIAATQKNDSRAVFSNWGSCVDMFAPGDRINSTRLGGGSSSTNYMSGTSQAAPFVTGTAAIYKSALGDSLPSVITAWLISNATTGAVGFPGTGSPNRLLYKAPDL